ncbi:MAG: hypothetical protein ACJ76F_14185 [Bacteroidia bacterium]
MKSKTQRGGMTTKNETSSGNSERSRNNSRNRNKDYQNYDSSGFRFSDRDRDELFFEQGPEDRFNKYASHKYQLSPQELRYKNEDEDDYFYGYMEPRIDQDGFDSDYYDQRNSHEKYPLEYSGDHETGYYGGSGEPLLRRRLPNIYGEHPDSRGAEEYRGSNKRHSGLGNFAIYDDYRQLHQGGEKRSHEKSPGRKKKKTDRRRHTELEYEEYMNREQFERPFHERDNYKPGQFGYDHEEEEIIYERYRPYKYEGYQSSGNVDGFGIRANSRHDRDWRDEDEYYEGHVQKKSANGKYGSR